MGKLADEFVARRPRELAGARTSKAYDYQKDWALCKLLDLHKTESDYLLVLEYHEDVVVFDSADNPINADFYQLKQKKTGNWTIGAISKPKNKTDSTSSILGKIFSNEDAFQDHARSLSFVSNQGLSCKLNDGTKALEFESVTFDDLSLEDKKKVRDCVHAPELEESNLAGLRKLSIMRTPLGVDTHRTMTIGNLAEFLDSQYPHKHVSTSLAYKTIFDEIRRKTNCSDTCTTHEDLLQFKSISQPYFANMIKQIVASSSSEDIWASVEAQLRAEHYAYTDILNVKAEWRRYLVERMDANNELVTNLKDSICKLIENDGGLVAGTSLKDTVSSMKESVSSSNYLDVYSNEYIEAAIICEVNQYDPVSKVSAKPAEETT